MTTNNQLRAPGGSIRKSVEHRNLLIGPRIRRSIVRWVGWGIQLLVATLSIFICLTALRADTAEQSWDYVYVVAVATDQTSLDIAVTDPSSCRTSKTANSGAECRQLHLLVNDSVVRERLKRMQHGDRIRITFTWADKGQGNLKQFCPDVVSPVSVKSRVGILLAIGLLCLLGGGLLSGGNPLKLTIGEDGRYSNSKFQIAVWFFVLVVTYLTTLILRIWYAGCDFIGGVNIPTNLLLVSGLSVITFAAAKAITTTKVDDEKAAPNGNPDPKNSAHAVANLFKNLTHNDGAAKSNAGPPIPPTLDFGDFQMLVITLIATCTYLVLAFNFLSSIEMSRSIDLPDIDTTILALFGLGHGAYLTKKAAGDVGQS
jgi:hypothetical protein